MLLDRLRSLIVLPQGELADVPWSELEQAMGTALPSEYKEFVQRVPPGFLRGTLEVFHPLDRGGPEAFVEKIVAVARSYQIIASSQIETAARESPQEFDTVEPRGNTVVGTPLATFYPAKGGMIPWGDFEAHVNLWWDTRAENPDTWPVVVCNEFLRYEVLFGSTIDCLTDLVAGRAPTSVFPAYFWEVEPEFVAHRSAGF